MSEDKLQATKCGECYSYQGRRIPKVGVKYIEMRCVNPVSDFFNLMVDVDDTCKHGVHSWNRSQND